MSAVRSLSGVTRTFGSAAAKADINSRKAECPGFFGVLVSGGTIPVLSVGCGNEATGIYVAARGCGGRSAMHWPGSTR